MSNIFKKIRLSEGLTVRQMADVMGVSEALYRMYESGARNPKELALSKFYDHFRLWPTNETNTTTQSKPYQPKPIDHSFSEVQENVETYQSIIDQLKSEIGNLKQQLLDERERVITAQEKAMEVVLRVTDPVSKGKPSPLERKKHTTHK